MAVKTLGKWCFIFLPNFILIPNFIFSEETTYDDVVLRPITSNEEFVRWLRSENLLKSENLERVLRKVDILNYVPPNQPCFLLDIQTQLEYGAFIEHPSMILTYLNTIEPHLSADSKVLEIGSGSGYLTHLIAELMNGTGKVIGVEHIPQLVNSSIQSILHSNPRLLMDGHIKFLVDQLKPGGRLVIPLGEPDNVQTLFAIDKFENGTLQKTEITRGSFGYIQSRDEQMDSFRNGTQYSDVNEKQRSEMLQAMAELAKEEAALDPKQKLKDLFESAKYADIQKNVESYERECREAQLMNDRTRPPLPYALEEVMHALRTPTTRKTRKRKTTTAVTTDNLLMWRKK